MSHRDDVEPAHLLRAVLDDPTVARVLQLCGTSAGEVRLGLDRRWLEQWDETGADADELLHARGVEVAQVLRDLGPGTPGEERWQGRRITPGARDVLVGALAEAAKVGVDRVAGWHLLVGLAASRDPLVAATLAEHGVRLRAVRRHTRRLGRRV